MEGIKTENRGGRRKNQTGRPKKPATEYSDSFKRKAMKALRSRAKELGMPDEFGALADLALNKSVQDTVRLGAWKIYSEMNVVKESKQIVDVTKQSKPQIYLPEPMKPPAESKAKLEEAAARLH
jgi:hypothetical protein